MAKEELPSSVTLIDENNLDRECIRLPGDYLKYAVRAADLKKELSIATASVKVAASEASARIRKRPEDYGMDKVTEAAISAAVLVDEDYIEAVQNERNAQHALDVAQAYVWAMEMRKRGLTLLVELHGMGYFSSAKVSKEGREAVQGLTKSKVRRRGDDDES